MQLFKKGIKEIRKSEVQFQKKSVVTVINIKDGKNLFC